MFDLEQFQREHKQWTDHNFPKAQPWESLTGAVEEAGELADALAANLGLSQSFGRLSHGFLKHQQRIRGTAEQHCEEMQDSIGDIVIFLSHFCNIFGFSLDRIMTETWGRVSKRDWIKHPVNGVDK